MGVISIGASLGLRATRTSISTPSIPSTSIPPSHRSSASSVSATTSSTTANSRKKATRKRLSGTNSASTTKKRTIIANQNVNFVRIAPLLHEATRDCLDTRRESVARGDLVSTNKTLPSVSMEIKGKKTIGQLVHVRTRMDPKRLAPHVVNDKLNAIMTRIQCQITYCTTRESGMTTEKKAEHFSMSFQISASTVEQVDQAVLMVQKAVRSMEQQVQKYSLSKQNQNQIQQEMGDKWEKKKRKKTQEMHVVIDKGAETLEQQELDVKHQSGKKGHAQTQIRQVNRNDTVMKTRSQCCSDLEKATVTPKQQQHLKRGRDGGNATSIASKRGKTPEHCKQQVAQLDRHSKRNKNKKTEENMEVAAWTARAEAEQRMRDEREAFRIRLARTVMISRRFEAEAKRVRAQEVLERDKYMKLRREFEALAHRKKVAEFVVKKQCNAMATSLSTSSSSKKKQCLFEVERLSVAHDACPPANSRLLVSNVRARGVKTARVDLAKSRSAGLSFIGSDLVEDRDLVSLVKKVQAFGKMITSGSMKLQEDFGAQYDADHGQMVDTIDCSNKDADVDTGMNTSNADETTMVDTSMETIVEDSEMRSSEKRSCQHESFRSTWDLPGLSHDLNLIQDYSLETDCKLLRLLAGERQYFYLEPLGVGSPYSREVERWLLTTHDIQILLRYLLEHANIGKVIVLCAERLRTLGNLLPPLPSLSSDSSRIGELGVFESSRHKEWSELQDKIVTLHSLALVAHMLGKHYLARELVGSTDRRTNLVSTTHDNLLDESTLESDLFTYILRPIRSSAIESSLFDLLPISLVRETIEQCPEVVNHVLQWKGKDDVPEYLRQIKPCDARVDDVASTEVSQQLRPNSSYFLWNLLLRLTAHMRDFNAVIEALVSTLKEKRPGHCKDTAMRSSQRHQHVIAHVNRLKSVTAHVVVENTKLQLHKWWVLFAENICTWFDPDSVNEMDDRSYDKFTCLQDALYIWHNEALLYTSKDDFVDPERLAESARKRDQSSTADGNYTTASGSSSFDAMSTDIDRTPVPRDEEMAALFRLTPDNLRDEVRSRPFTIEEARKCVMTPRHVENARVQLEESLASTRDLMNKLGRSGPWRTHVKHSNSLKCELAKQISIQKQLVKHQWARFYTKYQEFSPSQTEDASLKDKETSSFEICDSEPQSERTARSSGDDAGSMAIDWTGVFDPEKDAPDIIEMKKIRHEIILAKDQLLRNISCDGKNDCGVALPPILLIDDQEALVEACKGLATSCMKALDKLLGMEETQETAMAPLQAKHPGSTKKFVRPTKSLRRAAKGDMTTRKSNRRLPHGPKKVSDHALRSDSGSKKRRSESVCVAKALAASNVDLLLPLVRSSRPKTSSSRAMSLSSIGSKCNRRSDGCPPLRMGCSGCRDLRRRCTRCSGCCLHCVCVSCGCRMCCSSRLSAVQKVMTQMLDVVEAKEACKWMSNASAGNMGHRCGMLFFCQQCHSCEDHCPCFLTGCASRPGDESRTGASMPGNAASNVADSSSGSTATLNATLPGTALPAFFRKERRFRINPETVQRRSSSLPMDSIFDKGESIPTNTKSNDPSAHRDSATMHGGCGPLPTFDYGIDDAFSLGSINQPEQCRTWRPPPSDKNEQEDLFRAARVRMKLVRSVYAKSLGPSSGSDCLDGEQLWQPERIRMMWERRDFHGVLGLSRDASVQQIKRQYRKLALKLHPDKASDTSASLESTVAEADRDIGVDSGKRVDAFVAATHSYKVLLGDVDVVHGRAYVG